MRSASRRDAGAALMTLAWAGPGRPAHREATHADLRRVVDLSAGGDESTSAEAVLVAWRQCFGGPSR